MEHLYFSSPPSIPYCNSIIDNMMKSFRLLTISTLCYTYSSVGVSGQGARGTNKTLAPTPGVTRPPAGDETTLPPITPFLTEPPVIMVTPEPSTVRVLFIWWCVVSIYVSVVCIVHDDDHVDVWSDRWRYGRRMNDDPHWYRGCTLVWLSFAVYLFPSRSSFLPYN